MSRDQRVNDNWALLFAQKLAMKQKSSLAVIFCLVPKLLGATIRQYSFMIKGLQEVEKELSKKGIPFFLLAGSPEKEIPRFIMKYRISALITDFNPLRIKKEWEDSIAEKIDIPFYQIDAHNIIPCWIASPKQEYNAHTFRPKINRLLSEFFLNTQPSGNIPYYGKERQIELIWRRVLIPST